MRTTSGVRIIRGIEGNIFREALLTPHFAGIFRCGMHYILDSNVELNHGSLTLYFGLSPNFARRG